MAAAAYLLTGMHANAAKNSRKNIGAAIYIKRFLEITICDKGDIVGYVCVSGTSVQTTNVFFPPTIVGLSQSIFFGAHVHVNFEAFNDFLVPNSMNPEPVTS
jgi:hypothetical protein